MRNKQQLLKNIKQWAQKNNGTTFSLRYAYVAQHSSYD